VKNPFSRTGAEPAPESADVPAAAEPEGLEGAESTDFPAAGGDEARAVELESELARVRDAWLRAEADLQTFRRRAARELSEAERRGADSALQGLLTFADDLERALKAAEQAGEKASALAQGVALVLHRLNESLKSQGVTPIDPVDLEFDPREHEALLTAPSAGHAAGHVSQVIAKGWRQGDRLLRPARVIVSSGPEGA
jgi:molecular chaperone GrpE